MNVKRSQEDHPTIQDEGTEKGKQLRETRREQTNNGKAQACRRMASTGMEKPLWLHNWIPTVKETPLEQRNCPGKESEEGGGRDNQTTPKGYTSKSRGKRNTVPSCKETDATTVESSHIMGTIRRWPKPERRASQKQIPQTEKLDVEQQLVSRRHHGVEDEQGGGSYHSTEMSPKSSAESELETRIAKPTKRQFRT